MEQRKAGDISVEPVSPTGSRAKASTRSEMGRLLCGVGVEIGALHNPVRLDPTRAKVLYVDRLTPPQLAEHYPEMVERVLVRPEVVSDGGAELAFRPNSLDFIIASHLLEHIADPIGALLAWYRALRPGGKLLLLAPDPATCPDRLREVTSLEHLIADHETPSEERDFGHFCEWAQCWNERQGKEEIEVRARELLARKYAIHFHVWSAENLRALFQQLRNKHHCDWEDLLFPAAATREGFVGLWQKPRDFSWRMLFRPTEQQQLERRLQRARPRHLIACPKCKRGLKQTEERLICRACRRWYPRSEGIPVLLASEAQPLS